MDESTGKPKSQAIYDKWSYRSAPIPGYGVLDDEISELVYAMAERPGIYPIGSCAGHAPVRGRLVDDYFESNVLLVADSIACLHNLLAAFPGGVHYPLGADECGSPWISGGFRQLNGWPEPVFQIVIGAFPLSEQRDFLGRCVAALREGRLG